MSKNFVSKQKQRKLSRDHISLLQENRKLREVVKRLKDVAIAIAGDYPGIKDCKPWEQLYAIENTFYGTEAAIGDWEELVKFLQARIGLTDAELYDIATKLRNEKAVSFETFLQKQGK